MKSESLEQSVDTILEDARAVLQQSRDPIYVIYMDMYICIYIYIYLCVYNF